MVPRARDGAKKTKDEDDIYRENKRSLISRKIIKKFF
jgi:hypothetical protein